MTGSRTGDFDGVEMTASSPATDVRAEPVTPDDSGDHETVPVTIGYGALEDDETFRFSWQRLFMFAGPGLLMSIAYIDPGNLESDLQTGFRAGYRLGWIVLWSTVLGFIVQLLAMRLGIVTGKHLAEHCRTVYPVFPRIVLWLMTEVAIIGSDIQEVIGSAIAIQLLSNGWLPLWVGVLVTGVDTFFLLYLERFGVRKLEAFFGTLVAVMTLSFGVMYFKADCPTDEVILGTVLPRIRWAHMDIAVGIVGALVMPHNIFLHSALVQSRKIDLRHRGAKHEAIMYNAIESAASLSITVVINLSLMAVFAAGFNSRQHDIPEVGLSTAGKHLGEQFGPAMKYIWAIGLFAAGQSSTMTGTYTGQFVMSGFMELHVSAWLRACITRSVALVPTLAVAVAYAGSDKMDTLNQGLNVLQSVQLPFALIPVLYMSTRVDVMGSDFVLKRTFRTCVQLICGLLLVLNLSLVAYYLVGGLENAVLGLLTVLFCLCYAGFVVYLLVGPGNTWDFLSKHDSPVSRILCRWFGRERGSFAPAPLQQNLFVVTDEEEFAEDSQEVPSPLAVQES